MNSLIEGHLKDNPDDEKADSTKQVQDDSDCFTNNVVTLTAAKKLKKDHDKKIKEEKKNRKKDAPKAKAKKKEEDKEEEKKEVNKEEDKEEAKQVRRVARPKCKNCTKSMNGFQ